MHLPAPAPPIRGFLLWMLSHLLSFSWARRLVLAKLRKDTRISQLPEVP